jgi:hypothetical protein
MTMKKAIICILSLGFLLTACALPVNVITVRGSGNLVTESRVVKGFDRVDLATLGDLQIIQGDEEGLVVSAEENLLPHLLTTVRGSTLEIHTVENVSVIPTKKVTYTLKVKNISALFISSSGSISTDQLNAQKLELAISSSGNIEIGKLTASDLRASISSSGDLYLKGQVTSQDVRISSSGNYNAADLQSQSAYVNISSSGTARIWVIKELSIQLSSSGNVEYYGSPKVASKTSSSGKVNALGEHA